jgi:hypothetical protein
MMTEKNLLKKYKTSSDALIHKLNILYNVQSREADFSKKSKISVMILIGNILFC